MLNLVKNLLNKRKFKFKIFGRNKRFNFSGFKLVFLISSINCILKRNFFFEYLSSFSKNFNFKNFFKVTNRYEENGYPNTLQISPNDEIVLLTTQLFLSPNVSPYVQRHLTAFQYCLVKSSLSARLQAAVKFVWLDVPVAICVHISKPANSTFVACTACA